MNKEAIKGFIAWLEGAQADEIRAHQAFILASLEDDEELLSRMYPGAVQNLK